MTPKAKKCRKPASGITNAVALGVLALGTLLLVFDPSVAFEWLAVLLATTISVALWALSLLLLEHVGERRMSDTVIAISLSGGVGFTVAAGVEVMLPADTRCNLPRKRD